MIKQILNASNDFKTIVRDSITIINELASIKFMEPVGIFEENHRGLNFRYQSIRYKEFAVSLNG